MCHTGGAEVKVLTHSYRDLGSNLVNSFGVPTNTIDGVCGWEAGTGFVPGLNSSRCKEEAGGTIS